MLEFEKPLSKLEQQILELEALQDAKGIDYSKELRQLRTNYTSLLRKTYDNLTAWETVQVARHPQRPLFKDYVEMICREFRELHGDRHFGDDPAIMCGLARIGGHKVMLIGHHKGRDTKEKVAVLFRPGPSRRVSQGPALHEAGREVRPAGRHPHRHRPAPIPASALKSAARPKSIARNLLEMSRLKTPIVSIVTGEGGSGGALGIGVADRVAMMEYAWYSVISPEACSAILFKGNENAAEARREPEAHQQAPQASWA